MSTINLKDAEQKIMDTFPNDRVISRVSFKNLFIFSLMPKQHNTDGMFIKNLVAVNRSNGELTGFNPLAYEPSEYAKAVKDTLTEY